MNTATLLVCTVGGTPEAVAAAIKGCQPDRIIFMVSPQTHSDVETKVMPLAHQEHIDLSPGQYEIVQVPDAQDFAGCVEKMRELEPEVSQWLRRGEGYRVIVDFTGGTKCMSAALALVARRWPCRFSYVGGTERTKGGVGIVVNGKEQVCHTQNPWDSLGYQAAEEALVLFDKGDYQAAIHTLEQNLPRVERADLKEELVCLQHLAQAYLEWDLFRHRDANNCLGRVQKRANDLRHLMLNIAPAMLDLLQRHRDFLAKFGPVELGSHFVLDLCSNARRCAQRGRYDDGVARLYRAIEAIAQFRLREGHAIDDTAKVPVEKVPEPLRSQWARGAKEGFLLLGLQEDYQLLEALGDSLGQRFRELGLANKESPLNARNQSILAHGFTPVGETVFQQLWGAALNLAEIREEELVSFPRIGVL